MIVHFQLRVGRWMIENFRLFRLNKKKSTGCKRRLVGDGDKALTGASLACWEQWDRIL